VANAHVRDALAGIPLGIQLPSGVSWLRMVGGQAQP